MMAHHRSLHIEERESGGPTGLRRSGGRFAILYGLLLGVALRSALDEEFACQGLPEGEGVAVLILDRDHSV